MNWFFIDAVKIKIIKEKQKIRRKEKLFNLTA